MDKNIDNPEKLVLPHSAESPFVFPSNFSVRIPQKSIVCWETLIKNTGNA